MSLRFDPSHHVVDRGLAESAAGDPTIRVDNAVAAVALDWGDEFRVRASPSFLREHDPAAADALAALERVPPDERRDDGGADRDESDRRDEEGARRDDGGDGRNGRGNRRESGGHERRARLPEDRETVAALLDFESRFADDEDAWAARLFGVDEFAVLAAGTPFYRSIPHETYIRDLNDAVPGFVDAAAAATAEYSGVAVLPVDPIVRWSVDGAEHQLNAETVRISGAGDDRWRWFDLSKLAYVRAVPERGELAFQWRDPGGPSLVARARKRFTRLFTGEPPKRLSASGGTLRELIRTFARLREALDYEFVVDDAGLAGDDRSDDRVGEDDGREG